MKPIRVILNPAAGHGNGARLLPSIEAALTRHALDYDLVCTGYPGHAIELTGQAVQEGVELIVAAGGDGTLNEVVNGLMRSKLTGGHLPTLGVLCAGRGNDFSGSIGIPEDIDLACKLLKLGQSRLLDIGRVTGGIHPEGRYFINCVGVGFDAVATIEAAKLPRWGGFLSFLVAIFKTIFLYNHAPLATIEYGGQVIEQRSLMISIMNGRRLGGGFIMAPDSRPDDGLLDLCIAEQMSSFQMIRLVPLFMKGTQASKKTIKTGKAALIKIAAIDGPLPAQTDGEIISTEGRSLTVELLTRQIKVICPLPAEAQ
jgi:YegS/Rv2252/BmrU family lipid kinase